MAIALFELVNVEVFAGEDVTRRAEQLDEGGTDFGMCQRVRHLNGSFSRWFCLDSINRREPKFLSTFKASFTIFTFHG